MTIQDCQYRPRRLQAPALNACGRLQLSVVGAVHVPLRKLDARSPDVVAGPENPRSDPLIYEWVA